MSDDTEKDKRHRSFKIKRDIESPNKHQPASLESHLKDLALESVSEKNNESQACQKSPGEPNNDGHERKITYTSNEASKRHRVRFRSIVWWLFKSYIASHKRLQ